MKKILLIGSKDDPHIETIKQHIDNLNPNSVQLFFSDKENLLKTQFTYLSEQNDFYIKQYNSHAFKISNISAVFTLSPLYNRKGFSHTQEEHFWHFSWRESLNGMYATLSQSTFFTNNSIHNSMKAQNKLDFFKAVQYANILAPASLISNDKEQINNFFDNHSDVIIKTLHQIYLEYQGQQTMMLVKNVHKEQFLPFDSLNECPLFLQEKIQKIYDIRVTMIGKQYFACKIDASRSPIGNLDWRVYDLPNTPHESIKLPQDIVEKLFKILEYFNLDYATLDLCVDEQQNFWLLDVNPFGKYMWIELATNLPISENIAKFLLEKTI